VHKRQRCHPRQLQLRTAGIPSVLMFISLMNNDQLPNGMWSKRVLKLEQLNVEI
jgi:hypothetical protein